jgi:hypothetical protein
MDRLLHAELIGRFCFLMKILTYVLYVLRIKPTLLHIHSSFHFGGRKSRATETKQYLQFRLP